MACGEGYGSDVLAGAARGGGRRRCQPGGPRARPPALRAREPALRPRPRRDVLRARATRSSSCRRSSTSATPTRCSSTSRRSLRPRGVVLHLDAERPDAGAEGAEKSGNPWHVQEYRPEEFRRRCCAAHFSSVELHGLFHARKLRLHQLAIERAGWDAVHARLRITKPFYDRFTPAISVRDFALRDEGERDLAGALDFVAVLPVVSAGAAAPGELAIVLHTHMPYVEGFGTWPFGEEWLWEAMATSYLPLLDVLDAAPGGGARSPSRSRRSSPTSSRRRASPSASRRSARPAERRSHELDAATARRGRRGGGGGAASASGATTSARRSASSAARRRPARRARPARRLDLVGHPRRAAAARHRRRRPAAGRDGHRRPPRAASAAGTAGCRLPECAHAPWLDPLLEQAGVRAVCVGPAPTSWARGDDAPAAAAHRRRPAARPDRPRGHRARVGRPTAIRRRRPTATATA